MICQLVTFIRTNRTKFDEYYLTLMWRLPNANWENSKWENFKNQELWWDTIKKNISNLLALCSLSSSWCRDPLAWDWELWLDVASLSWAEGSGVVSVSEPLPLLLHKTQCSGNILFEKYFWIFETQMWSCPEQKRPDGWLMCLGKSTKRYAFASSAPHLLMDFQK